MQKTAFASYAHDDQKHKTKVLVLANRLREEGVDVTIDQYEPHPAEGWPKWMEKQLSADHLLVVLSPKYITGFNQGARAGSGARYEGAMISAKLMKNGVNFESTAVVLFAEHEAVDVPDILYGCQRYFVDRSEGYESLYRFLTSQPKVTKPALGKVIPLRAEPSNRDYPAPLLPPLTDFRQLCHFLVPVLRENHRIFRDFGPNSGARSTGPVRYDLDLWYRQRDTMVIPEEHRLVFERLLSHIDAFEMHVSDPTIDYREHQFPKEVGPIVEENASR